MSSYLLLTYSKYMGDLLGLLYDLTGFLSFMKLFHEKVQNHLSLLELHCLKLVA